MQRVKQPSTRSCLLLAASLFGCSSQLDLGHDLRVHVTAPSNGPASRFEPDASASDASSDAPDAANGALDAGKTPGPLSAPRSPTASGCVGIPCFGGPVLDLATSAGNAKGLVLDADDVFWAATAGQAVMVTPKDGSETGAVVVPNAGPFSLAEDDINIYFTSPSGGYVASTPKAQPRLGPKLPKITMLASGEPEPTNILLAGDGVYFSDDQAGTVKRIVADHTIETLVTGLSAGCELAIDADSLYYVDSAVGEIHAVDRISKANTRLTSGLNHPVAPLASGDELYFLELGTPAASYADGRFSRMPRAGGPIEVLVDHLNAPTGLAADTAAFYLCESGTELNGHRGRIVRLANTGEISTLAVNQAEPFAIAVDGTGVYWTTDSDNGLHSVQR